MSIHRDRMRARLRRQHHQGRPRGPEALRLTFSCYVAQATGGEPAPSVVAVEPQQTVAWADRKWERFAWPVYTRRRHPLIPTIRLQGKLGSMQFRMPRPRRGLGGTPPVAVCLLPAEHERPDFLYGAQAETRRSNHVFLIGRRA